MSNTYGDSPTRPRHTHSAEYRSAHVADSRKSLMRDIPEVPEVHLDSLMDAVLPAVRSDLFHKVCDQLIQAGCLKDLDSGHPRWEFLPDNPSVAKQPEAQVFRFLEKISQAITTSLSITPTLGVKLKVAGQTTPLSKRRNTSRPDGFFHMQSTTPGNVNWADIIMPMEFKNKYTKQNQTDDFAKVMWSMHHTMRNDPRRRYVHGLSCENTKARLWYHDRSDVVVSEEFDVNMDWKYLVRIILSVVLATPVDLGYDPTVRAVTPNDVNSEPSYNITIHNADEGTKKVYRTVGILSDVGADGMVCRGTRVWEVRELVDGVLVGPTYALKDVWVHEDRMEEHLLLWKIRTEQPEYSQHLLTPVDHGFVPPDPDNPSIRDNTHTTLRRGKELKPTQRFLCLRIVLPPMTPTHTTGSKSQKTPSGSRDSVGHSDDIPDSPWEGHRDWGYLSRHPRQHYRMVFKEIGTPVHDLRTFTDVFTAIQGGWEGLHAIHRSLHVHRDVSSGNILLVPASEDLGERGVIMDLEYGKAIDDMSAPHDVKTGTAAFMATEVALMSHHRLAFPSVTEPMDSEEEVHALAKSLRIQEPSNPLPPFRHNPLHDMESIWWLCIWMMFYLIPSASERDSRVQLKNYHGVFRNPHSKRSFIGNISEFDQLTPHLSETPSFASIMKSWSIVLNKLYSVSYKKQHTLAVPPTTLRVSTKTVDSSYTLGRQYLADLKEASASLSACVTLSERCPDPAFATTILKSSHRFLDYVPRPATTEHPSHNSGVRGEPTK